MFYVTGLYFSFSNYAHVSTQLLLVSNFS